MSLRVSIAMGTAFAAGLISSLASAADPASQARVNSWTMGQTLAACHLVADRKRLEAALLDNPATSSFDQWAARRDRGCDPTAVQLDMDFYRYAVAEALFRRKFETARLQDLSRVPALPHARAPLKPSSRQSKAEREQAASLHATAVRFSMLGECVVRANPVAAHALLSAKPTTEPETAALTNLLPSVDQCVDKSRATKMEIADLRGAIALNYVRLAEAARTSGAGAAR